jgi:hypothetical protein
MQVISSTSNHAAQMKASIEQQSRLPLRLLVRFLIAHQKLDLFGEKTAD